MRNVNSFSHKQIHEKLAQKKINFNFVCITLLQVTECLRVAKLSSNFLLFQSCFVNFRLLINFNKLVSTL